MAWAGKILARNMDYRARRRRDLRRRMLLLWWMADQSARRAPPREPVADGESRAGLRFLALATGPAHPQDLQDFRTVFRVDIRHFHRLVSLVKPHLPVRDERKAQYSW